MIRNNKESRFHWEQDCLKWQGKRLNPDGKFAHWCNDWDDLPVDDTCPEFESCTCYSDPVIK